MNNSRITLLLFLLGMFQITAVAATHVVIIAGKGGTEEYTQRFSDLSTELYNALQAQHRFPADQMTLLVEDHEAQVIPSSFCSAGNIESRFAALADQLTADDQLLVVLIGHGTDDGTWAKFNIPGKDLRDLDFLRLMNQVPARRQVMINTTAASSGFVEKLSRPDRVIITATRSPNERYATLFPQFLVEALATRDEVDFDKDQRISLLELFDYTRDQVVRFYEQENRLRPEHPLLDDNGDGAGSETPTSYSHSGEQPVDGSLAARLFISAEGDSRRDVSPALAPGDPLIGKRVELLAAIEALKKEKSTMPSGEYERQIEQLFIELARLNRQIKKRSP